MSSGRVNRLQSKREIEGMSVSSDVRLFAVFLALRKYVRVRDPPVRKWSKGKLLQQHAEGRASNSASPARLIMGSEWQVRTIQVSRNQQSAVKLYSSPELNTHTLSHTLRSKIHKYMLAAHGPDRLGLVSWAKMFRFNFFLHLSSLFFLLYSSFTTGFVALLPLTPS